MERFNSFSSDTKDIRNSDHIILTKRQVSMIMASTLLFCLFVFIVGFFLGKRTVIEDFSSQVSKEALHDQVDFLLTMQSLQSSQEDPYQPPTEHSAHTTASFNTPGNAMNAMMLPDVSSKIAPIIQEKSEAKASDQSIPSSTQHISTSTDESRSVYAQLIGFGTKKAAQAFVTRLKKHGIPVILKTMMSKTASGKQRTWYQAITPTYSSMPELDATVAKIKQLEHIRGNDIKIVFVK